jgi:DNA-binding transcriptional LysR family regulator
MLELRDLRLLTTIAANGSLVRAGRVLGITQSGLTRALAALEARLQAPLFDRSRRGLEPTDACRAILALASPILDRAQALDATVAGLRDAHCGTLALAAGPFALETVATAAAARFLGAHPTIQLRIDGGSAPDAVRDLRERRVDIAVAEISDLDAPEDFRIEPLRRHPIVLLARAGHPLSRQGRPVALREVFDYPTVTTAFLSARVGLHIGAARQGPPGPSVHPTFPAVILESVSASLAVAAASDAVTASTVAAASMALGSGALVVLPCELPWLVTNFGILALRKRPLSVATEALIGFLHAVDAEAFALARSTTTAVTIGCPGDRAVVGQRNRPALNLPV